MDCSHLFSKVGHEAALFCSWKDPKPKVDVRVQLIFQSNKACFEIECSERNEYKPSFIETTEDGNVLSLNYLKIAIDQLESLELSVNSCPIAIRTPPSYCNRKFYSLTFTPSGETLFAKIKLVKMEKLITVYCIKHLHDPICTFQRYNLAAWLQQEDNSLEGEYSAAQAFEAAVAKLTLSERIYLLQLFTSVKDEVIVQREAIKTFTFKKIYQLMQYDLRQRICIPTSELGQLSRISKLAATSAKVLFEKLGCEDVIPRGEEWEKVTGHSENPAIALISPALALAFLLPNINDAE